MLLATKYEEKTWGGETPGIKDFASIADNAYTTAEIRQMERVMLRALNFDLGRPLPLHFLRRASKAASVSLCSTMFTNIEDVVITLFTWYINIQSVLMRLDPLR